MKQKLEKYLLDSYKHRLLDKLHSLYHGSKSAQEYTTKFDDLTLRCEARGFLPSDLEVPFWVEVKYPASNVHPFSQDRDP